MTQSAVAFKDTNNGYEQRSDGLWIHSGSLQVAPGWRSPGGTRLAAVLSANGRTDGATDYGLQVTNQSRTRNNLLVRDDGLVSMDQLAVAQGIPTSQIQANAVQQPLGNYQASPTWNTNVQNAWVQTPIAVTVTTAGGLLRCEWTVTLFHSAVNGQWFVGFGWDNGVTFIAGFGWSSVANLPVTVSGIYYVTLGAGPHPIAVWVDSLSVGTLNVHTSILQTLWVTEQKR